MNTMRSEGRLLPEKILMKVREQFYHVDSDPRIGSERLFFDNAGGALRLKASNDAFKSLDELPDCPEHSNKTAVWLNEHQKRAEKDLRILFNASRGVFATALTASEMMFDMTRAIVENISGSNIVTTKLEHPSAYDAAKYYAEKTGKELRVAETNPITGGVDVKSVIDLIDQETCALSVIWASNISGAVLDIGRIIEEARKKKPDIFVICDAVQHAPHGIIDVDLLDVDAMNIAPYKFGCPRGMGYGYLSDRAARLTHDKLLAKEMDVWELGSPASGHFAAISAYVEYVCWLGGCFCNSEDKRARFEEGMSRIIDHERALMSFLLNGDQNRLGLRGIEKVSVFMDGQNLLERDFILAVGIDGMDPRKVVECYENLGIITFERVNTSAYSSRMLNSLEVSGCVRVSPLHCHSIEDMEKFLDATIQIVGENGPQN